MNSTTLKYTSTWKIKRKMVKEKVFEQSFEFKATTLQNQKQTLPIAGKRSEKTNTPILQEETEQQIEKPEAGQRKKQRHGWKNPTKYRKKKIRRELTWNHEQINGTSLQPVPVEFARTKITEVTIYPKSSQREVDN